MTAQSQPLLGAPVATSGAAHPRVSVAVKNGVVAAAQPLAAMAGLRILLAGGNAFDAAAAVAAALNVAEPFMSGLAGMGVATFYSAREGRVRALDFTPPVPANLDLSQTPNREALRQGAWSVGVPGNLAGWEHLVRCHGRLSFADVLAPAIELAEDGVVLSGFAATEFHNTDKLLRAAGALVHQPWAKTYCPGGALPEAGTVLRQPALAQTLRQIAKEGIGLLYGGALGAAMVARVEALGGWLSQADLRGVRVDETPALSARYRGTEVHVPPPPSSEGFQYLQSLRILEAFDFSAIPRESAEHLDTVFRAIRLAAAERIAHNLPDAATLADLLSDRRIAELVAQVRSGQPIDAQTEQFPPPPDGTPAQHTTSMSIADREGNVICLTQSLGAVFGSGVVLEDYGVCLNNFLVFADVHPMGTKRLVGGGPLALPLAPSLVTRDGKPILALGTPGSYGIPQHQAQVQVRHLDYGLPLQEAIEAPRARLTDGRAILLEERISPEVRAALAERGHEVEVGPAWTRKVGGMQGVAVSKGGAVLTGGADPRRDGYVVGY